MKIAVCVKGVPDASARTRIDPATKRLDRSGEAALNAFDVNAVEEALRLQARRPGRPRSSSSRSGPSARSSRCARRSRWAPTGSCSWPTTAPPAPISSRPAAASRPRSSAESPDLVLFGQQASDADGAVLWAAVADRLQRPLISQVAELTREDGELRGKRQTEYGYDVIEAPLPAVVAVSDAINEPRYPSLKGIMGAKRSRRRRSRSRDLGVDADEAGEAGSRTDGPRARRAACRAATR